MNQTEIAEYIKCYQDPVYYLNNYGYVFDIEKRIIGKLTLYDFQIPVVRDYVEYTNNIILKSRQQGLSVITAGYVAYLLMFGTDERILIIANDYKGAKRFVDSVKIFLDNAPEWMLPDSRVVDNQNELKFSNGCSLKAVASSPNAGRGEALTLLVLDETAFIEHADDIWMGAGIALSVTGGKCIMISTPYGTGNLYHRTWVEAVKAKEELKRPDTKAVYSSKDFNPIRVHWATHPVLSRGLEWRTDEFGIDKPWSPWYEGERKRLEYDNVKIAQELDLSFEGSKNLVIDNALIDRFKMKLKNKVIKYFDHQKSDDKFVDYPTGFKVWHLPEKNIKYIVACLPPGEKILTDSGLKNIEDVTLYDKLINEKGEYVKIENKQVHKVENEDVYEIKVDNTYRTTSFTKEHPILVSKPTLKRNYNKNHETYGLNERYWDFDFKYTKSKDLNVGDWIKTPNIYKNELDFNINDKWNVKENIRKDFLIDSPLDNKNFWWFIGLWLGDGWIGHYNEYDYSISICFNKKETYYVDKCLEVCKTLFNRIPNVYEKDDTYNIQFNCKELYFFLLNNFGKYADGKKISEWVKFISKDYKLELIKGYFDSDGCWIKCNKNNKTHSKISFVSINLELLESIQDILFSVGIISSLNKLRNEKETVIKGKSVNQKKCYNLCLFNFDSIKLIHLLNDNEDIKLIKHCISDFDNENKRIISSCHFSKEEDFIYFRIKNIKKEKFTGNVYNFECDTHTFMCHHITTHNCDVARGDGSDFSTIQVLDALNLKQVAEYSAKIPPDQFAKVIKDIAFEYNMAYVAVECNSFGLVTSLKLRNDLKYPVDKLFHSKTAVQLFNKDWNMEVPKNDDIPGWQTTTKTRPLLIATLQKYMREGEIEINSEVLLDEFKTFIYTTAGKSGEPKAQHAPGYHDDLILALAIALVMRDTEFQNTFWTADNVRAMMEGIQVKHSSFEVNKIQSSNGSHSQKEQEMEDDDLSWLYGPIKG